MKQIRALPRVLSVLLSGVLAVSVLLSTSSRRKPHYLPGRCLRASRLPVRRRFAGKVQQESSLWRSWRSENCRQKRFQKSSLVKSLREKSMSSGYESRKTI